MRNENDRRKNRLKAAVLAIVVLLVLLEIFAVFAEAAPSGSPTTLPKAVKDAAKEPAGAQTLWNSWYTVTVGEKIPFGYYNDKVERRDGKIAYQNQLWKTEEGFINEERVVSFGKDDANVTPLLFNFLGTYRESEFSVDGTFAGTTLKVKARRNKQNLPPLEVAVPSKAFLSTLFPVWIGKRLPELKIGKRVSFATLFEDALDSRYSPISGSLTLEAEDAIAKKTGTKKLAVEIADVKSVWYVLPSGEAVRIENPAKHQVAERRTEAEARRFLIKRTDTAQ